MNIPNPDNKISKLEVGEYLTIPLIDGSKVEAEILSIDQTAQKILLQWLDQERGMQRQIFDIDDFFPPEQSKKPEKKEEQETIVEKETHSKPEFKIDEIVAIPRSDHSITPNAKIISYDPKTNLYKVRFPNGEKEVEPEILEDLRRYPYKSRVVIVRDSGEIIRDAVITGYDAEIRHFIVDYKKNGKKLWKKATSADLDEYKIKAATNDKINAQLPRRVTEFTPAKEVIRPTEVMAIGDLHGSLNGFWANLESLELVDENHNWKGANRQLIFIGDILADRNPHGLEILLEIRKLRTQAQKQGGKITVLAGNHDEWAIAFLMDKKNIANHADSSPIGICAIDAQGLGIAELQKFMDLNKKFDPDQLTFDDLFKLKQEIILKNMRSNEEGKKLLKEICHMQIAEQIDDTLFIHTDPTQKIAQMLIEKGIDHINQGFQNSLRMVLLEGKPLDSAPSEFYAIVDTFLDMRNRCITPEQSEIIKHRRSELEAFLEENDLQPFMTEEQAHKLQAKGINHIIVGHTDKTKGWFFNFENHALIGNIFVQSVDFSAHKKPGYYENERSIGKIEKDGKIKVNADLHTVLE